MNLTLPMPPSVNAMYRRSRGGYGMYKTKEAKSWIAQCYRIIKANGYKSTITDKVGVDIHFYFFRESDVDNRIKALLDLIQSTKIIENDKQVYSISATKDFDKSNPRVEVEVSVL